MNFIVVIIIMIVVWFVNSILQSYRSLHEELRLVRMRCVPSNDAVVGTTAPTTAEPTTQMKSKLIEMLELLKRSWS